MQPNRYIVLLIKKALLETLLLERIKKNPAVFAEVFNLYYKAIFGCIFRRIGNFDISANIAAFKFLKACQHIGQFEYRGISVKIWLYLMATNEVNLYYRNQQKHERFIEHTGLLDAELYQGYIEEDRTQLENELLLHNQFLVILKQVKQLPIKYQEVIALRYFEGKDNREVAEILHLKEGTFKSLLSRGLEKLREKCNQI